LRVKTKTSNARVFQRNAKKDGAIFQDLGDDYCVLVDILGSGPIKVLARAVIG
jgi:hypothetical protein